MWVVSHFGSWESSPMVTWWPLRVTASTGSVLIGTLGAPLCWLLTGWDAPCRAEVGSQGWLAWCTGFRIQPRNVAICYHSSSGGFSWLVASDPCWSFTWKPGQLTERQLTDGSFTETVKMTIKPGHFSFCLNFVDWSFAKCYESNTLLRNVKEEKKNGASAYWNCARTRASVNTGNAPVAVSEPAPHWYKCALKGHLHQCRKRAGRLRGSRPRVPQWIALNELWINGIYTATGPLRLHSGRPPEIVHGAIFLRGPQE